MDVSVLGVDLGKNVCSVVGFDAAGQVVVRRRLRRDGVAAFVSKLSPCVIALEACCGAHHMGRIARTHGHDVRLMPPEYVRPYVKAQKNDERDAEAIAEAATRPTMRFVDLKSEAQLDMQSLHRVRARLVSARTGLINQLRAILFERGMAFPQGRARLRKRLAEMPSSGIDGLSARTNALIDDMVNEWDLLDQRIGKFDAEFAAAAKGDSAARLLATIPGIGTLNATAIVAAIGSGQAFARGRDFAAWLGLVPKQATTGGKPRLLGITKRGNVYIRKNLIHGARAALPTLVKTDTALGRWLRDLVGRTHKNRAIVALANKLARIAWAVLRTGQPFNPRVAPI